MAGATSPRRFHLDGRARAALWWVFVALLIHLVPVFLPRKVPSHELELARMLPDAANRIPLLVPLLENSQATPENLRQAAELVLPASAKVATDFLHEAERRGIDQWENDLLHARICRAQGDRSCVEKYLARARSRAPDSPGPELTAADLHALDGDTAQMLAALTRAHEKAREDVDVTLRLVRALAAAGRVPQALEILDAQTTPRLPPAELWAERGRLLLSSGNTTAARDAFVEGCRVDPKSAELHYLLGVSLVRLNDSVNAARVLREADRLNPSDYRPLALLCASQREDLELEEAALTRYQLMRRFGDQERLFREACP